MARSNRAATNTRIEDMTVTRARSNLVEKLLVAIAVSYCLASHSIDI